MSNFTSDEVPLRFRIGSRLADDICRCSVLRILPAAPGCAVSAATVAIVVACVYRGITTNGKSNTLHSNSTASNTRRIQTCDGQKNMGIGGNRG